MMMEINMTEEQFEIFLANVLREQA